MKTEYHIEKTTTDIRIGFKNKPCFECKMTLNGKFRIIEKKDNNFRGDDECFGFHLKCGLQKDNEKLTDWCNRIIN